MLRRSPHLVAAFFVAATFAVTALLVAEAPRRPEPLAPPLPPPPPSSSEPAGVVLAAPTAPRAASAELKAALARGAALAADLDPLAETVLEEAAAAAKAEEQPALAARAEQLLARFRRDVKADLVATARWTAAEGKALAAARSPAAVGRLAEAIAAARAVGDTEGAAALAKLQAGARDDLRAREVERVVARLRADPAAMDGAADPDERIRKGFAKLATGDVSDWDALVRLLLGRADAEHATGDCAQALDDIALARRAVDLVARMGVREASDLHATDGFARRELRCRLDEGGRAIQRGDGVAARALLDLGELQRLDGRSSASPHVLYLLGRALEADGDPEEARKHYWAAIGTATWLARETSLDVVRDLARRRALRDGISIRSPGAGPTWRALARARFTLVHELPGSAGSLARRVETARTRALARLGFADPIRIQASKTVVFVYANEERYRGSGSGVMGWAIGHANMNQLEDGRGTSIVCYEPAPDAGWTLEDVLVHEWAHVLVDDHTGGARLPSWCVEGVAAWCESASERSQRARALSDAGTKPWAEFLRTPVDARYVSSSGGAASAFYSQSLVAFETLAAKCGSAAAVLVGAKEILATRKTPLELYGWKDEKELEAAANAAKQRLAE